MVVKIKELVDEMGAQMDGIRQYLNKETGEILTVSNEDMAIVEESEEGEDFSQYPEWKRESIQEAFDFLRNWDKYVELPDKWEINEYHIMEQFCDTVDNEIISAALYNAITGKGAFRHFKDKIRRYRVEDRWYSYREGVLQDIAISWCEMNNISYHL